jgi:ketosteroid isomerase-like protein
MKVYLRYGVLGLFFLVVSAAATADPTQELIELDKEWGAAGMAADAEAVRGILSDDVVSVSEDGIGGLDEELANLEAAPEGATYQASDYEVTFLDDNTAIMSHSVGGEMPHYSLHVWSHTDDGWRIVATSSTPASTE